LIGQNEHVRYEYLSSENGSAGDKFIRADRLPIGPRIRLASSRLLARADPTVVRCRPHADHHG
jgi:hypothetical protein